MLEAEDSRLVAARRFTVAGHVQGVGFRFWTRRMAEQRGLRGWVRNRVDGMVEVHAEGDEHSLEDLHRLLEQGPPASSVTAVDVSEAVVAGHTGFSVRPTA